MQVKNSGRLIIILLIVALGFLIYWKLSDRYIGDVFSDIKDKLEQLSITTNEEEEQLESENLEQIVGKVTRVSDGDTVVLTDSRGDRKKIRLDGINAPEIGQEYGDESREFVNRLAYNKRAKVVVIGIDKYKRILGVLYVDDVNINEALLENGLAWQYHYNKNKRYEELVKSAQKNRLNIWSKTNAQDPYYWRKENTN